MTTEVPTSDAVTVVADLARRRGPTLGSSRLVCVDGPAGSGKTTLASALAGASDGELVHTDDLLLGWEGLPGLPATLAALLAPLAEDRPGRAPRYDWVARELGGSVTVAPNGLLVVEGVGAGSMPAAGWATVLVWVEAPYDVRMRRGLERDGDAFAPHWEAWAAAEAAHFAEHRTRERADVVVDGTGGRPPVVSR